MIEQFNVFYTNNMQKQSGLFTCNDIEIGISKYLWAEVEFSFMYGHARQCSQQTFGLNYLYTRFFTPIYQGKKLNISSGIGFLTPSWYTGSLGNKISNGKGLKPTFGINIDYNITERTRIDWQLFYRRYPKYDMIFSGLSYKINIKPLYTWIYADNYINLKETKKGFIQYMIVMTHPFGKNDRYLIGGSISYIQFYGDKKFDINQASIGFVFCADFDNLWS